MTHRLFVYGTLRVGHGNWSRLLKDQAEYKGQVVSNDANYAMIGNGVPFLFEPKCKKYGNRVRGDLFEVDDQVLAACDQLERHPHGYRRDQRWFRVPRKVGGYILVQAWVYLVTHRITNEEFYPDEFYGADKDGVIDFERNKPVY